MSNPSNGLILVQLRMAIACFCLAIFGGMTAALHYVPDISQAMNGIGATLPKLRPLHTSFASVWIFGAAIAVVYHYLAHSGDGLSPGDRRRFWFHTCCWLTAGATILVTLLSGISSGREYLGFHPACSVMLLLGWFAFAFNFLRRLRAGFWAQPVYLYFWTVGILFFVYTFVEGHAYLLPWVEINPIRDLQIQWKSCGTLVGSFNFLVYGALIYITERMTGDKSYGQSRIAFWLFGVGCLNSFTNYAHHTYHLPQSEVVKQVAFVVSMLEVVIFLRLLFDLVAGMKKAAGRGSLASSYLKSAKWWTTGMLFSSLLISVPMLNSVIHGTQVVTGHAMGTELGIDSMILFGAVTFLFAELHGSAATEYRLPLGRMRVHLYVMNSAMVTLVLWLTIAGTVHGYYRGVLGEPTPTWVGYGRFVFPITGGVLGLTLLHLFGRWMPLLGGRAAVASKEQVA